ncbi:MAG: RNA polymerase-binding protein DksA [Pseudomonadota bacterium]|uniref:RNA polymerase-binding protein DksA n=1 Tax=Candidatus Desulfatibia profunda TaxID=2841695 RepID=A0A8J6NQP7_9BACT|nr:RNA polymerase-binding protein DksA [Candidatus Desulfatibia profunda]MBL7179237.1 RNA polymerase-binding protein DksA [Desulfobacterales bacterium]
MKQKDIKFFKNLLADQLEELLGQADITLRGLIDDKDNLTDIIDRASFESDRGTLLRIRDRESRLIRKIQKALENLENGNFGICEKCGKDISIERLKARPVTTYCIECKTKMEALEA